MPQRLSLDEFKSIYAKVPRICVELLIEDDRGVLWTMRAIPPMIGQWHLPGGTVLMGEKLSDVAHRVAQEELNIEIELGKIAGVTEWVDIEGFDGQAFAIVFRAKIIAGEITLDRQASQYQYFSSLPENAMVAYHDFFDQLIDA